MNVTLTPNDLIAFEDDIAQQFSEGKIRAPIHLAGGNERQLIDIFAQHVQPEDWVLCTWRSHYHALLKGVPPERVKQSILDGRSISLCFPDYRLLSSAIVAGAAPIAVGLAMGIRRKNESRKVVCFLGDMAASAGIVHESMTFATGHNLPVLWVVEDNGLSVCTPTSEAWGSGKIRNVISYGYQNPHPHCGLSKWVSF